MEKGNSKKLYNSRIIFSVSFLNNTKQKNVGVKSGSRDGHMTSNPLF